MSGGWKLDCEPLWRTLRMKDGRGLRLHPIFPLMQELITVIDNYPANTPLRTFAIHTHSPHFIATLLATVVMELEEVAALIRQASREADAMFGGEGN